MPICSGASASAVRRLFRRHCPTLTRSMPQSWAGALRSARRKATSKPSTFLSSTLRFRSGPFRFSFSRRTQSKRLWDPIHKSFAECRAVSPSSSTIPVSLAPLFVFPSSPPSATLTRRWTSQKRGRFRSSRREAKSKSSSYCFLLRLQDLTAERLAPSHDASPFPPIKFVVRDAIANHKFPCEASTGKAI